MRDSADIHQREQSKADYVAGAGIIVWVIVVGLYVCDMPGSIVCLLSLVGIFLFIIADIMLVHNIGSILVDLKKIERDITRHYKERGW